MDLDLMEDSEASSPAQAEAQPQGKAGCLLRILGHPLLLLLVGTLLSSYLIPSWTRQWQDRQAELEVKVDLVGSIDEAVTEMVMAVQYAVWGSVSQSQEDYDLAYRHWEVQRHVIRSRLEAYFPETSLADDWEDLSEEVSEFYAQSGTQDPEKWDEYIATWGDRREELFEQKDELNKRILDAPTSALR